MSRISEEQTPRINSGQVEHIAKLARIELSEKEKEKFAKDLSSILDYVEQLNKVDTSKVEGFGQVTGFENVAREDIKHKTQDTKYKLLKNVPSKKGDYIKVPKILE